MLIIKNENMSKYVTQHISANQYYIMCAVIYNRCSALMLNKADRNNSVTPLQKIENADFINENQRTIYIWRTNLAKVTLCGFGSEHQNKLSIFIYLSPDSTVFNTSI